MKNTSTYAVGGVAGVPATSGGVTVGNIATAGTGGSLQDTVGGMMTEEQWAAKKAAIAAAAQGTTTGGVASGKTAAVGGVLQETVGEVASGKTAAIDAAVKTATKMAVEEAAKTAAVGESQVVTGVSQSKTTMGAELAKPCVKVPGKCPRGYFATGQTICTAEESIKPVNRNPKKPPCPPDYVKMGTNCHKPGGQIINRPMVCQ